MVQSGIQCEITQFLLQASTSCSQECLEDKYRSFSKWMEYMAYDNVNDLCDYLQFELKRIHDLSDCIVDGQQF